MYLQGPLIWNALDADLKTCKTLQSFKAKKLTLAKILPLYLAKILPL